MTSRGAARTPARILPAVLALASCALPVAAQAQEGPRPPELGFGDQTSIVVVEVPVNVVLDGKPLRGLKAENFEVLEGKKAHRIVGFDAVDLAAIEGPAGPATPVPIAARRHFLLLFDLTFAQPKSIIQARHAALRLVREGLHPTDLVAVGTYSASRNTELVLAFTADREQAAAAIDSLGHPQLLGRAPDPLQLVVVASDSNVAFLWDSGQEARALREEMVREHLKEMERLVGVQEARVVRNQVTALAASFTDLANMMAAVDGRKHVVYLSEGFDPAAGTGRGLDQDAAMAVARGESWKAETDQFYGSSRVQNDVELMLEAFRRADCVIQAVNVGGAYAGGHDVAETVIKENVTRPDAGRDSLLTLAKDTGGELFENTNDLGAAMGTMLERTGVTYLLTVQPDDLPQDGSYHSIKVRLKDAPRGARVHHRAGYYAPDPRRRPSPAERRLAIAAEILAGEEGGALPFSVLALPAPGAVPLVVEVAGADLLGGPPAPRLGVEIYAYALDRDAAVQGFLTQRVDVDLDKVRLTLAGTGLKFSGALDLPPGEYSLRVLVRDSESGAQGLRNLSLTVPASPDGPLLLPPLFSTPGTWILARQARPAAEAPAADPFMVGGRPFLPAARPVLAAGSEAAVGLVVYNLGAEVAQVRASVLDAAGRPVTGGKLTVRAFHRGEGTAPGTMEGSFSTAGLAPGEYRLRVTVVNPAGGASHTSSTPFVVGAAAGG